jgi:uncharacterized membrane protein
VKYSFVYLYNDIACLKMIVYIVVFVLDSLPDVRCCIWKGDCACLLLL